MLHICPGCGFSQPGRGRCARCGPTASERSKLTRRRDSGRNLSVWAKLRTQAIILHPYCATCGGEHDLTAHHLRYPSDGERLTLEDVRVLCRTCHGTLDQAKQR